MNKIIAGIVIIALALTIYSLAEAEDWQSFSSGFFYDRDSIVYTSKDKKLVKVKVKNQLENGSYTITSTEIDLNKKMMRAFEEVKYSSAGKVLKREVLNTPWLKIKKQSAVSLYNTLLAAKSKIITSNFKITEAVMCEDVVDWKPVKIGTVFEITGGTKKNLHCFLRYQGAVPNKTTIQYKWYYQDDLLGATEPFTLKNKASPLDSPNNYAFLRGNYRIDILIDGQVVHKLYFEVKAFTPNPPQNPQWISLGKHDDNYFYYDKGSIEYHSDDAVRVWVCLAATHRSYFSSNEQQFTALTEINLLTRQYRFVYIASYKDGVASTWGRYTTSWGYIQEGSILDALYNIVCRSKKSSFATDYATFYFNQGNDSLKQGLYDKAIEFFTKAIELNPKYVEAYKNRGNAYLNKKLYDNAMDDYNKAIELNPEYAPPYNNRGLIYFFKGLYDKAIKEYNKAIELDSKFVIAYRNRGNAYKKKGMDKEAEADFKKARELESK